ncbi:hypothetical protein AOQ84DRAFT_435406 [Glonium stellatum]|uniref:RING-type domain-containing protein n=1 Tax=Glonium stellatum TaxID=574774 RepID=A0A8E2JYV4_9PEZI|nr:hypothetical protein AOQ84DRAFT_435406 [Glonium stellatum]
MTEGETKGMVDLEKELSCSICTDVLYQPLTLLDCLHTFCGACLKEWFQFQASTATSIHPYTCPSCRASVRGTKPNATVTTLLDMFLQANPSRGKSDQEKDDQRKKYKPGENVLPKLRRREEPGAEEDRRLVQEVQELSLREVGISSSGNAGLEAPRDRRRRDRSRDRSRDTRDRDGRQRRTRDDSRSQVEPLSSARRDAPPRHVEHQSSLRSLLSASELDSQEMEEEIMRQIMEEGLLDGIDLTTIDVSQEDEISERIAQAYRRRQRERQRERQERQERQAREGRSDTALPSPPVSRESRSETRSTAAQPARDGDLSRRRQHARSESATVTMSGASASRPPVSRPQLIDAANNNGRQHHRRSSSQGSTRSLSRPNPPAALSVTSSRQGARSAGELTDRPSTSDSSGPRRRMSHNDRSATDPDRQLFRANNNALVTGSTPTSASPRRSAFLINSESSSTSTPPTIPSTVIAAPTGTSRRTTDPTHSRSTRPSSNSSPSPGVPRSTTDPSGADARPATSATTVPTTLGTTAPTVYNEPNLSCNRCGKQHIEYDLHYNCSRCDNGKYNLCLSCYRQSKGCKHWYGFGYAAWQRYERQAPPGGYPPNHEPPHILRGHKYTKLADTLSDASTAAARPVTTNEDPTKRLQSGVFCDMCLVYADSCYWKCDFCNEGAWGFCNDCVNQGRHCTHPLLPVALKTATASPKQNAELPNSAPASSSNSATTNARATPLSMHVEPEPTPTTPPLTPKSASLIRGPGTHTIANAVYRPLTFTTACDICRYPIPPSHTRFHCPHCNNGDYDICTSCYHNLVSSGRISVENGHQGWRRCLRGHRMVVVGFEDRDSGQRRIVTRDLVGGLALRDEDGMDSQAVRTSGWNADVGVSPNWSWRDVDGTVRKSRTTHGPSGAASTSIGVPGRFPPDGGVGLRVITLWGYFPADGVEDELMFPKNAEVREAHDINGDWFWGCYAGAKGLFPGNYGRVL